jgi:hypothetical protein
MPSASAYRPSRPSTSAEPRRPPDHLPQLTGHQALGRLGLYVDRDPPESADQPRRGGEQEIAREDRDRVAPALMRALHTAAQLGLIHDVVVVERREVDQLAGRRSLHHFRRARLGELGREQGEHGAEPLPARGEQVAGGLPQQRLVAVRALPQQPLHGGHS